MGIQQLSLFDENLLSSPKGEVLRGEGKAHQATAASEKTEGDLNRRVRTRMPGGGVPWKLYRRWRFWASEVGLQEQASNRRKLRRSRAGVVSVTEKARQDRVR